jgi:uncharacterized protein YecE (DUF72 family)
VYSDSDHVDYLAEYAQKYTTVEVDQWFWSLSSSGKFGLPRPADVERYRDSVSADFRFTAKVPNSVTLTHYYKNLKSDPLRVNPFFLSSSVFQEFVSALDPIKDVLGPLIFQFEYLNKQKMSSQQKFFEQMDGFVRQLPRSHEYAVETRNANYLNENYFEFLNRNHLSHVFLQGYWMPSVVEIYQRWRPLILEQDKVVIRLHGPNRQEIERKTQKRWDKRLAPKPEDLVSIVEMTSELLNKGVSVYLNVNNHYEGSAPLTIEQIKILLAQSGIKT